MKKIIIVLTILLMSLLSVEGHAYQKITVAIDPGHGGRDGGAYINGVKESDLDLKYGLALERKLTEEGFSCVMTRTNDTHLPPNTTYIKRKDLDERIRIINNSTIFISIHMNSYSDARYSGAQVFYADHLSENVIIAKKITEEIKSTFNNNRSERVLNTIYLLKNSTTPGVIVECGFMSNPQELLLLQTNAYQDKFIGCLVRGIKSYLCLY